MTFQSGPPTGWPSATTHRSRPAPRFVRPRALSAAPITAGFAVVCAATALSGVLRGGAWLFFLTVTIGLIVGTGMTLRSVHAPIPVVGFGQLFVLLCLLVTSFTTSGVLFVLPGPAAIGDLLMVLHQAIVEVQTKASPVTADSALLCLVLVAGGLVAIIV
ncbi:MAG: transglutaminase, partial [Kutzneria sp.]|nr:transglutaminase [Kutzneria sp.]